MAVNKKYNEGWKQLNLQSRDYSEIFIVALSTILGLYLVWHAGRTYERDLLLGETTREVVVTKNE